MTSIPENAPLGKDIRILRPNYFDTEKSGSYKPATKWQLQDTAGELLSGFRVASCGKHPAKDMDGITRNVIFKRTEHGKAAFSGLAMCGSVWHCPVCAQRISTQRREELQELMQAAKNKDMGVHLLTLTVPHQLHDKLENLLPQVTEALRKLKSGRGWKEIVENFGIIGGVRALEITHGANGWHPHTHEMLITAKPLTVDQMLQLKAHIYVQWSRAAKIVGLGLPDWGHGVDVKPHDAAAEYISKWGFQDELTTAHIKHGKKDSRTPFDLLRDYRNTKDSKAGGLFKEYAKIFHGRRQLVWSKGLKDLLIPDQLELLDEEIAEMDEPKSKNIMSVPPVLFYQIMKDKKRDFIVSCIESESYQEIINYLYQAAIRNGIEWDARTGQHALQHKSFNSNTTVNIYVNLGGDNDDDFENPCQHYGQGLVDLKK